MVLAGQSRRGRTSLHEPIDVSGLGSGATPPSVKTSQHDTAASHRLHLNDVASDVQTLGPPGSTVVWVQRCPLSCPGCMSPGTTTARGGRFADVADVALWIEQTPGPHLTISGGEPTAQAPALVELLDRLGPAWLVTMYSGYDLDQLEEQGPEVAALLRRVDLLIAGPYVRELHSSSLWRGSSNQVLADLTGRIRIPPDVSAGIEVRLVDNAIDTFGVPPTRDYLATLRAELSARSLTLLSPSTPRTFPFPTQEV